MQRQGDVLRAALVQDTDGMERTAAELDAPAGMGADTLSDYFLRYAPCSRERGVIRGVAGGFHAGFIGNEKLSAAVLRNTVRHKATLNLLGQVLTERFGDYAGGFDVKYGVYIPLVNIVRHLSLFEGVWDSSTLKRLEVLGALDKYQHLEEIRRAFLTALRMRANTPYSVNDGLLSSSDYIAESDLKNKQLMSELRESLLLVRRLHRALQRQLRSAERRQS